jgi:hypothetical protein
MQRILGHLAHAGSQRGHDAAAIDQAQEIRHAEPEARIYARLLPVVLKEIVHEARHQRVHGRALQTVGQRSKGRGDQMLVPVALARDFDCRGHRRRPRSPGEDQSHSFEEVVHPVRRKLGQQPARHRARRGLEIRSGEPRGAAPERLAEVETTDLLRHELLGEHTVAYHAAHTGCHQLPVRRDERGVRNGEAERAAEDRRHREPVRQPTNETGLGDGEDPPSPPGGAERVRDHRGDGGHDEHRESKPALAAGRRAWLHGGPGQRRRGGSRTRARFASRTPRGVRRTDGKKPAAMKNRLKSGS